MTPLSRASFLAAIVALSVGCATPPRTAPSAAPPAQAEPAPRSGALAPPPTVESPVRTLAQATLGAVGDVMMHEAVKRAARVHGAGAPDDGFSWLYAPVADLLAQPDVMFANLETPVAPDAAKDVREFMFNAPPQAVSALKRAGVDLVSVANNHVFDQGRAGFEETLRRLEAAGMPYVGAGPEGRAEGPVRVDAGGLRLAFLGWSYGFNQGGNDACPPPRADAPPCPKASLLDREKAVEAVRAAAREADAVVVSVHWGIEYQRQPRREDVELAHRLADAGALVVLGHHPHVLQPLELYRRADGRTAVIAYSLGNFISNQERKYVHGVTTSIGAARDAALLRVALARRDYGRGVVRVEVAGTDWLPLWTENDTVEIDPRREPARRPAIRVVAVDRALAAVRAELATLPDPVPPDQEERFVALRRREATYLARRAAIAAVMGDDLERTLSPEELALPASKTSPTAAR